MTSQTPNNETDHLVQRAHDATQRFKTSIQRLDSGVASVTRTGSLLKLAQGLLPLWKQVPIGLYVVKLATTMVKRNTKVVPLLFIAGAIATFWNAKRKWSPAQNVEKNPAL